MSVQIKVVTLPACTVAGGYQTDIQNEAQFYNFTGEQFEAIFSLGNDVSSYFFTGDHPMHIFGPKVKEDTKIEDWMMKRFIKESEYVYFYNPIKENEPYDEGKLIGETWSEVEKWMNGQSEYVWSDVEGVPNMIVSSTDEIGYHLYKSIKKVK